MIELIKNCPECGDGTLLFNKQKGEIVCRECGLVLDDKLIQVEIPRKEDGENLGERDGVGSTLTYCLPDKGLFTTIGNESDLKKLPSKTFFAIKRLKKLQARSSSALERNLTIALGFLRTYASQLKLSQTLEEEACRIYTEAAQRGIVKGRSLEHIAAASIYIACRNYDIPISLLSISKVAGPTISKAEIGKAAKIFTRKLNIKIKPQDPSDYIAKVCSVCKLSYKVQSKAALLVEQLKKKSSLSGRCPFSIAAATVYIASILAKEKKNQKDISTAASITEVTLRNRYNEFVGLLDLNLKPSNYKK